MRVEGTTPSSTGHAAQRPELDQAAELLAEVFPSRPARTRSEIQEAIRDFQKLRGLEPHGRLDPQTLDHLQRSASWIRHERTSSAEPSPATTGRASAGPVGDTQHALLAKALDAKVDGAGPRAPRSRPFEVQLRAPSPAERAMLGALLGATPAWQRVRDLAVEHGKTIVIGYGGDGTVVPVRGFAGGGIYFGPDGELGFCGSGGAGINFSQIVSASVTAQIMVLDGGIDLLEGRFVMVGAAGGEGLVGGAAIVLDEETMEPVGYAFEGGIGAGVSPIDIYFQGGWGARNQPLRTR